MHELRALPCCLSNGHVHVHTHARLLACAHARAYACVCACVHAFSCMCACVRLYACVCACVSVREHIHMRVRMCVKGADTMKALQLRVLARTGV